MSKPRDKSSQSSSQTSQRRQARTESPRKAAAEPVVEPVVEPVAEPAAAAAAADSAVQAPKRDLTVVYWMLEYSLAHNLTSFVDPMMELMLEEDREALPYHLRKLIELTAMEHGLRKHVQQSEEGGDGSALALSLIDAFIGLPPDRWSKDGASQFYAVLVQLVWQVLLSPLRIPQEEERARVFQGYALHLLEGYALDADLAPVGEADVVNPLQILAPAHVDAMREAVVPVLDALFADSAPRAHAAVESLLEAHPPARFWRAWERYVAPLRAHLGESALDRVQRTMADQLQLKSQESFEALEEPDWLDSVETFAALHGDRDAWHAIHEGTDPEVQRFLEERSQRAAHVDRTDEKPKRVRPRQIPHAYSARAPPVDQQGVDEIASARVVVMGDVDSDDEALEQPGKRKRTDAPNGDEQRSPKRSRVALLSEQNPMAAPQPRPATTVAQELEWRARKASETILRLGKAVPLPEEREPTPVPQTPASPPKPARSETPAPVSVPAAARSATDTPAASLPAPSRAVILAQKVPQPPPMTPLQTAQSTAKPAQTPQSNDGGKKRIPWSDEETRNLYLGVERFGVGEWARIFSSYPFNPKRRPVDLKDKWRNMNLSAAALVRKDNAPRNKPDDLESIEDDF